MAYVPPHKRAREPPHIFTDDRKLSFLHDSDGEFKLSLRLLQLPPLEVQWKRDEKLASRWKIPKEVPRDVVSWAIANMLATSLPVISVLESNLGTSACLCCHRTSSPQRAQAADASLLAILRYFSPESHMQSSAFYRETQRPTERHNAERRKTHQNRHKSNENRHWRIQIPRRRKSL